MKKLITIIGVTSIFVILTVACSHSRESGTATTVPTSTTQDICKTATLEDTEIGVSSTEITVLVSADVGSPLSPGLFQGSIDGTKAWAKHVNDNGGLACRKIKVLEHDSMLNPIETSNGFLKACEKAVSMVGSTSLLAFNVEDLNTCPDKAGQKIGIADFAERAVESGHACSPNVFNTAGNNLPCPPTPGTPQLFENNVGLAQWLVNQFGEEKGGLHGVFTIPSDLPSAINASMSSIRTINRVLGIGNDGEMGVSASATQASYGALLEIMRTNNSNYSRTGSNDDSLLKFRREAAAQGGFDDVIWSCSLACYTTDVLDDEAAEGTYLWISFLPFEERQYNPELDAFITAIGKDNPDAWAAGAWAAGRLFEQIINEVVADKGLNGITRAAIFEKARATTTFTANGWFGKIDLSTKPNISKCFVVLQVQGGKFVRKYPTEPGVLDCNDKNLVAVTIDPAKEFTDGPQTQDRFQNR